MAQKSPVSPISKAEAAALTDHIRKGVEVLWLLLLEAHDRKAWKALGYSTWDAYVRAEFGMGRSRSYQLLDQGRVIEAMRDATGDLSTTVDISERDARDIKADLSEVMEEIRTRVEQGEDPKTAVAETVDAKRAEKEQAREARKAQQAEHNRQREGHAAALPDAIKDMEAAKQKAIADRKARKDEPVHYNGLSAEDRVAELEESVRVLEAEAEVLRAENKLYGEMRVQFEQGGFEKVIAGKDEEIRVLQTRVYRESEDKASWARSSKFWKEKALELGWSNDEVIPLDEPAEAQL